MVLAWKKPEQGWRELNTDSSAKRNIISTGGAIRTHLGQWILGFTKFIGKGSCSMAEAWVLFTSLHIANLIKISNLEIEIDNQEFFTLICNPGINNHPLVMLISDCWHLFSSFDDIKLSKVKRSQKKCSDVMAKTGKNSKLPLRTFVYPPPFAQQTYMEDLSHL